MQQQLSDAEHQYRIELESTRSKYEQELQNMQRELSYQITKLQDEVARVEAAKQNAIALSKFFFHILVLTRKLTTNFYKKFQCKRNTRTSKRSSSRVLQIWRLNEPNLLACAAKRWKNNSSTVWPPKHFALKSIACNKNCALLGIVCSFIRTETILIRIAFVQRGSGQRPANVGTNFG